MLVFTKFVQIFFFCCNFKVEVFNYKRLRLKSPNNYYIRRQFRIDADIQYFLI